VTLAGFVAVLVGSFVVMEPLTAATHRWVMHGVGEWFHRSHHQPGRKVRWERNDWFPVAFATIVVSGMWVGFNRDGFVGLVPAAIGVTLYGAVYALVHDGYIHRRIDPFGERRNAYLDHVAESHRIHHLYNGAPYGMLVPVVPADLRARAARTDRDPFAEITTPASSAVAGPA
jgi:beta-carotene 3-hydroxylase